ncbi:hypothetical protein [uncultured Enterovirga sp.]|uniref:hypothetical protein n=1 Tax=uncultured Enterovirga sp. TaxID=2026352 RepID=UPI0035C9B0A8
MNQLQSAVAPPTCTVLTPTWSGHLEEATALFETIRATESTPIDIVIVISAEEVELFRDAVERLRCRVFLIEDLVKEYTGVAISGAKLLKLVDRYRYQTLKKFLAIAKLQGNVLLIDSESRVVRDLNPIFAGGLPETTVFFTERPWGDMPRGLAKDVNHEVNFLSGRQQPFWYFESLNWLFSSDLVRGLLAELKEVHGVGWAFRPRQLFESQLYFQYARRNGAPYRFIAAEEFLAGHFGAARAQALMHGLYHSPLVAVGIFEYLARFVTREEYAAFISKDEVLRHFRLVRYEPYEFYDVIGDIRKRTASSAHFFGEAAMHRGPLLRGRAAVLLSGPFTSEQDAYNARRFLAGVDCDVVVAIETGHPLIEFVTRVLQPVAIVEMDRADQGSRSRLGGLLAAYGAFLRVEASRPDSYGVLVAMRPDIMSMRGLRDLLWDSSETVSDLSDIVIVPNRFWAEGLNDHLLVGLRPAMGALLDRLSADEGQATNVDMSRRVGWAVLACGLRPIPGDLPYVLGHPDLADLSSAFSNQQKDPRSRTVSAPVWKDATAFLEARLAADAATAGTNFAKTLGPHAPAHRHEPGPSSGHEAGRAAILLCGHFEDERDLYNVRRFLAGLDCDIILTMDRSHWLLSLARDVLNPVAIVEIDGFEEALGSRSVALAALEGPAAMPSDPRAARDAMQFGRDSMSMFDQFSAAYDGLLRHEAERGDTYGWVVRMRPDIFSTRNLRQIVGGIVQGKALADRQVFFPNRFWSEGLNDHLFLGTRAVMGALLEKLTSARFLESGHLNAQHHLARAVLGCGLQPIPFDLPYLLGYPPLHTVSGILRHQDRQSSARPVQAPAMQDATAFLSSRVSTTAVAYAALKASGAPLVRAPEEVVAARSDKGASYIFLFRKGASAVAMLRWPASLLGLAPFLVFVGLLKAERTRPVVLSGYSEESRTFVVRPRDDGPARTMTLVDIEADGLTEFVVRLYRRWKKI